MGPELPRRLHPVGVGEPQPRQGALPLLAQVGGGVVQRGLHVLNLMQGLPQPLSQNLHVLGETVGGSRFKLEHGVSDLRAPVGRHGLAQRLETHHNPLV